MRIVLKKKNCKKTKFTLINQLFEIINFYVKNYEIEEKFKILASDCIYVIKLKV